MGGDQGVAEAGYGICNHGLTYSSARQELAQGLIFSVKREAVKAIIDT